MYTHICNTLCVYIYIYCYLYYTQVVSQDSAARASPVGRIEEISSLMGAIICSFAFALRLPVTGPIGLSFVRCDHVVVWIICGAKVSCDCAFICAVL